MTAENRISVPKIGRCRDVGASGMEQCCVFSHIAHISSNEENTRQHVEYHHPDVDFCNRSKYYRPALPELRSCETCGIYIGKEIKHGSNEMHIFLLKNSGIFPHTAAGTVLGE